MKYLQSKRIQRLVHRFESVLSDGPEESIQAFLKKNDFLLDALSLSSSIIKLAKVKLGSEYVTDFVLLHGIPRTCNYTGPGITFIEIERADKALFTASGDPSAVLTHAIRQVQDWKDWIESNRGYATSVLKAAAESAIANISSHRVTEEDMWATRVHDIPRYLSCGFGESYMIIAGRRYAMSMSQRLRLKRMNEDLRQIEIITFDELLDRFLHRLRWFRNSGWYDCGFR